MQRITGSIDCAQARTLCTRQDHFLKFVHRYNLQGKFLTNNKLVTDEIIERYTVYLLSGYTINDEKIMVDTIKGYLRAVNNYYKAKNLRIPWDWHLDTSHASKLLADQKKFERQEEKREPLPDKVMAAVMVFAENSSYCGLRRVIGLWTNRNKFTGCRRQEFCMA